MSLDLNTSRLTLRLKGTFQAADADGVEISGLSRRGQGLLAYLSQQQGMRAERGFVADLLWSDRSEDQARTSLRQELSVMRKVLPEGILEANRQHVWLDADCVLVSTEGNATFLEGFDLPSEGFEDWLRTMRSADQPVSETDEFFERPSVMLFAFEALSSGENDEMIAAGIADDLRTTLSYWRWFPVIGPDAIGWKTAQQCELREVAAELGAAYAVTGSLRCIGDRIRISVALVDVSTGRSVWSENFAGVLEDIFEFQENVSREIVAQLEPQIARAEAARIERARPDAVAPWQLMAIADDVDRRGGEGYGTRESNFEQVALMEQALQIAPDFAPAFARLARINFRSALMGWGEDREEAFERALAHANRALEIDRDNWEAHAYSGVVRTFGLQDYSGSRFHGLEAVRLNPSATLARHGAGCALEMMGEVEAALEQLYAAFRLNPHFPSRAAALGDITTCEMFIGNEEAALRAAGRLIAIAPDYVRGLQRCIATYGHFGKAEPAAEAVAKLKKLQPGFDEKYVRETYPFARRKEFDLFLDGLRAAKAI